MTSLRLTKPSILVVARGDMYHDWCRMMGLHPRRDALHVYSLERAGGLRGHPWVRLGPVREPYIPQGFDQGFDYSRWCGEAQLHGHHFIDQPDWHTLCPEYVKLQELNIELDRVRTDYLMRIANCKVW